MASWRLLSCLVARIQLQESLLSLRAVSVESLQVFQFLLDFLLLLQHFAQSLKVLNLTLDF